MKDGIPLLVLIGPTASGKTDLSVGLAEDLGTEIISADSRQIYRGMDIGTAKSSDKDRRGIAHHLIDIMDPDERFSAGRFAGLARGVIENLHGAEKIPLVVGGTGFYIKALLGGLWSGPPADWALRDKLREEESIFGAGHLHRELKEVDPESSGKMNPNDLPKIIRAIEVYRKAGIPLSEVHRRHPFAYRKYRALVVGLRRTREDLYRRIEDRVDRMVEQGLEGEVQRLLAAGFGPGLSSMKGLGYRQMVAYLDGRLSREEAIRMIKRDTRRYAKRQWTWFSHDPMVQWVDVGPDENLPESMRKVRTVVRSLRETVYA